MKKSLYLIAGLCWGIFVYNKEILWYAITVSTIALLIDFLIDDKEDK